MSVPPREMTWMNPLNFRRRSEPHQTRCWEARKTVWRAWCRFPIDGHAREPMAANVNGSCQKKGEHLVCRLLIFICLRLKSFILRTARKNWDILKQDNYWSFSSSTSCVIKRMKMRLLMNFYNSLFMSLFHSHSDVGTYNEVKM